MSHSNTPTVIKRSPLTICSRASHCWTVLQKVLQKGQGETTKASHKKLSIMKYSPRLPEYTKSLRSSSGNRAKMLLKCHLGIKYYSQYIKVLDPTPSAQFHYSLGMHCAWPGEYHSLSLTRIQIDSIKVTPLTNPAEVTNQGLCYCNSNYWGWHDSHQSEVIGITVQLKISQMQNNSEVYRRNNNGPKHCPAALVTQH